MNKLLMLEQKLVPEMVPLLLARYQILRSIRFSQPVGRRALADQLHLQERKIRNEVELLKDQELLTCTPTGMTLTTGGEMLLTELEEYIREIQGMSVLEHKIATMFNLKKAMVVPGDTDQDESVKKDLARLTAAYLLEHLKEGSIVAVTGGTTMAEVAGALGASRIKRDITIVPARGGLGEEVEIQANTVVAKIAKGLGGNYRLLHAPDDLRAQTMQTIVGEPRIKEVLDLLRQADMVLHGIGPAEEMARRRGTPPEKIAEITRKGAVGEAFGYYFTIDGVVVDAVSSVGLQLAELSLIDEVVAVAGGRSKAMAVKAVLSNAPRDVLIIDEGAALVLIDNFGETDRDHQGFNGGNTPQ